MVRTYAVTGSPLYKQHYQEILDIRDGKSPRPLDYQNIYWDLVSADDHRPRAFGHATSLLELMRQSGFTPDEFAKLAEAKANSDGLTHIEFDAMKLVEQPELTDALRFQAISNLNDAAYHQAKADIMRPIDDFYQLVEKRTQNNLKHALELTSLFRAMFIVSGLIMLVMLLKLRKAQLQIMRELKDKESFAHNIIESMAECAYGVDHQGNITFANRSLLDVLLYDNEAELIGKNAHALLHHSHPNGSHFPESACPINVALAQEQSAHQSDEWFWCKDGTGKAVEYWAKPLVFANGSVGSIVTFVDITARKQAATALLKAKERIKAAADAGIIGIWDWDVPNNKLIWDEVMFSLYGVKDSDFGGAFEAWSATVHPDDKAMAEGEIQAALRGERDYAPAFRVIWPDGSIHFIKAASKTTFDETGKPLRMIGVNYDLTKQNEAEQELRQAKLEADVANRAKSEFLANMSHEIRTPMNAVIGLSMLGLELPGVPSKLRDYLEKIQTSSKSLLMLINNILDYSKVEAGRLELDPVEFNLEELLDNVANLFTVHAEGKDVEMVFDIDGDIPPFLMGDELRIGQIMNNLVGNAVKFTHNGSIHVKVELLDTMIEADQTSVKLGISVSDTGIGISPEQSAHLFEAFSQADGSITRRFGGTGLGLVISQQLVEKMGGELHVTSDFGVGSRFSFEFTLPVSTQAHIHRAPAELQGMRVLVVDDSDISREIISQMLESWNFTVTQAASGSEALKLIKAVAQEPEKVFELILLDWKMPEMDGVTVAQHIREMSIHHELNKMPVVLMVTAYSEDKLRQELRDIQVGALLTKPVNASRLFDAVMKAQGGIIVEKTAATTQTWFDRSRAIHGAHILLVEDNDINQLVARDLLAHMGVSVSIAENGMQALSYLQDKDCDLVLMDIQMPVMDGLEASRRIRTQARFEKLPVIAMTAAALVADREACLAAGMNAHIAKPIDPNALLGALLEWIPARNNPQVPVQEPASDSFAISQAPNIAGIDSEQALFRLSGNRDLFHSLLKKVSTDFSTTLEIVREYFLSGQTEQAVRQLHSLRGVLGNIAATYVHELASRAETAVKENSDIEQIHRRLDILETELQKLFDAIRDYLNNFNTHEPEESNDTPMPIDQSTMDKLVTALAEHDLAAVDYFKVLRAALSANYGKAFATKLAAAIEDLDFVSATEMLSNFERTS